MCAMMQFCPPGGGPPPHVHTNEDELFIVFEGEFEMFDGTGWSKVTRGEQNFTRRGQVHTFRNCGSTDGSLLCVATPGNLDRFFEQIAPLSVPQDMGRIIEISAAHGISYVLPGEAVAA